MSGTNFFYFRTFDFSGFSRNSIPKKIIEMDNYRHRISIALMNSETRIDFMSPK